MKRWQGIVLHHSAGADSAGCDTSVIANWHVYHRGWEWIGYHYVVERLGDHFQAVAGRPLHVQGAHCPGLNRTHLGVCLVGNYQHEPPSSEQLLVAARLCAGLCEVLVMDPKEISGHGKHRQTECPGRVDVPEFRGMVRALILEPGRYIDFPPQSAASPANSRNQPPSS